jgi:hypothetical protein
MKLIFGYGILRISIIPSSGIPNPTLPIVICIFNTKTTKPIMQLCSCRWQGEVEGNLAKGKELLSLAWREVGGGASRRMVAMA